MKKRIFYGTFLTCVTAILLCIVIVSGVFYTYYSFTRKDALLTEFTYLLHMAESHGAEHIDSLDTSDRIVIADSLGDIIIDGKESEKFKTPFEKRTEFINAAETSPQYTKRYLTIYTMQNCVYQKLSNGNILCLYDTYNTYPSLVTTIIPYILGILLICAPVCLLLSKKLSEIIVKPVYEINLRNPDKEKIYTEFHPLIDKINDQNQQLLKHLQSISEEHEMQDKMRREFTANVSHELKTPLTSIAGYAEIMRDGLVKEEDIRRFSGKIHDESMRMITLVGDIIKLSQLDEKDINVKIERIDLFECCRAVLESLEHQAKKKNVTLSLSGDKAQVSGAEIIIEEIIHNICDNAIKYNKDNGRVDITIHQCIDGVELSVRDTGIGIPKEDLDHVFERFYRVDKSHSKEIGGTGLGLSIVKHGAKFHNASISIDSELGKGTTVRLLF